MVNIIDVAILITLAALLLKGLWLGLIQEFCGVVGISLGIVLASRYHSSLAAAFPTWSSLPWLVDAVCFSVLLLATLLFFALFGLLLSRLLKLVLLGGLNRVLGGLFGLCEGVLLLALGLYGLSATDWFKEERIASKLSPPFVSFGEKIVTSGQQFLP